MKNYEVTVCNCPEVFVHEMKEGGMHTCGGIVDDLKRVKKKAGRKQNESNSAT